MSNVLELSDEEFEKQQFDIQREAEQQLEEDSESTPEVTGEKPTEVETESNDEDSNESTDSDQDVFDDSSNDSETEEESTNDEVEDTEDNESEDKEEVVDNNSQIDYKSEYTKLLAPFKANGREMRVESVEDARQLMQMGANYNKKMAALKPNLKLLKMLENNGLMDESKLSFLIDLDKKNPNAIQKLLGDSGLDPLDLDTSKKDEYKPNTYTVNDRELELDAVLEDIKDTSAFNTTLEVIGTKWDDASKRVILDNPGIIRTINEHVELGIYDQIISVVERERMLGRLTGLSDIEAYKAVGDAINAQGGFSNHQSKQQPSNANKVTNKKVDPKLASRKKAASSTSSKTSTKQVENFNPLSMSDEDFDKLVMSNFI